MVSTKFKRKLFYGRSGGVPTLKNQVEFLNSWAYIESVMGKQNPYEL